MKRFVTCFLSLLILLTASESFAWTIDYNIQERFAPQNAYCSRWISKQEAIDNVNADCESGDLGWYSRDPDYACRAIVTSDIDSCNAHSAVSAEYELVSYCEYPNVVNPATNECEPPPCESPNYVDVVSGECLAPRSVCFTSIHTEENECTYIGGEDPDDPDLPEGCTRNYNTGDLICVGDDTPAGEEANCYSVNGERFCPSPEAVCGNKNGTFSCIEPQEKGCGSFNGENVCVDPTGHVVPETSPDHPDNGGNLDGDDTNDLTDSRPPDQGGDPSNQPDSGTTTDGGASEKQQKLGNKELSEINKGIGGLSSDIKNLPGQLTETNDKTVGDYFNDVVEFGDAAIFGTGVDALIDGIDGNPMEGTGAASGVDGLGEGVLGFLPSGSCSTFSFSVGLASFQITCESSKRIRDILGFLLYAYTMMFMLNIVTDPVPAGKR
ncbi:hypothetical protein MIH18_15595 [Marinobacter sp. M3C]|jgi:hypothetical protein|uniref:hypothetical protein n=1 Tax=Marinobacter sp. M3C TaxID=2917715 RepID=UPI0020109500|nr:hypothetical protein [Marinobacter sp. M3C]MCL1478317.1 hypothetical protein [Marinobacter sp.]MCL1480276.1 hypothetical protein [Marinobacter sp.]UQG59169.1 hypothetical protein MIH18_15595 [Marinobacter sp. M3C]